MGAMGVSGRRLYVNGELDSTSPNTSQISSTTIQPSLGNRQGGGRALSDGVMHWFFAFNTNIGDVWHRKSRKTRIKCSNSGAYWSR